MTKLERAFLDFHMKNPAVYKLFDRFALEAWNTGRKRFTASMIWERIRWYTTVETTDVEYKLNNNHRAYYARLWMSVSPSRDGFFRTRRVDGDRHV